MKTGQLVPERDCRFKRSLFSRKRLQPERRLRPSNQKRFVRILPLALNPFGFKPRNSVNNPGDETKSASGKNAAAK